MTMSNPNFKLNADIDVDGMLSEFKQYDVMVKSIASTLDMNSLSFPFIDELKTNVDDADIPLDTRVNMCIYQINQGMDNLPFLEFLLYMEGGEKDKGGNQLTFPYIFSRHTKSGLVEQCTPALFALFSDMSMVKYVGYIYEKSHRCCTLFFNKFYVPHLGGIPLMESKNKWFWTLSSEIFNEHKVMQYVISNTVVSFFNRHHQIMQLKLNKRTLESPCGLYAGKHFNYVSYMAEFGVKKASTRAHFGPYYYFVSFIGSMRYACYSMGFEQHVLDDGTQLTTNQYGKHSKGGVVRFAVFLGRCRAFFMNGDEDRSELSMYWANQDPFVKAKLSLRDINGDWTSSFDSAYVGEYELKIGEKTKHRLPNWTIKDYDNQIPLSCHEIDMKSVPSEYDPEFINYKLV
jgi:hypothetical protein